jgi:hypothetical protein
MGDSSGPRISADFNYSGRLESGEGITYLNPKSGDRNRLNPRIRDEIVSAGFEPQDGMMVRLVEAGADVDNGGRVCDMEVAATIRVLPDGAWVAVWDWDAMEWIPSEPETPT